MNIRKDRNVWRDQGKPRNYRTHPVCKEKRRFPDEVTVRAAGAVSLAERHNCELLWCYRCPHCSGWHLTSKNLGRRWAIAIDNPVPIYAR